MCRQPWRGKAATFTAGQGSNSAENGGEVSSHSSSAWWNFWIALMSGVAITTSPSAPSLMIKMLFTALGASRN